VKVPASHTIGRALLPIPHRWLLTFSFSSVWQGIKDCQAIFTLTFNFIFAMPLHSFFLCIFKLQIVHPLNRKYQQCLALKTFGNASNTFGHTAYL
jgi:hypothetical protein